MTGDRDVFHRTRSGSLRPGPPAVAWAGPGGVVRRAEGSARRRVAGWDRRRVPSKPSRWSWLAILTLPRPASASSGTAATTENPSFSVVSPLLSRLLVLQLQPLTEDEVRELLRRVVKDERGLGCAVTLSPEAEDALVRLAAGDARSALTALEASADGVTDTGGTVVDVSAVERAVAETTVRYDRQGDQHHDVVSAFIKSIRGSDPDAALHYLARMLVAGEDPRFIARRLVVHASEDVGLADPTALQAAVAAAQTVQLIGMPEARLALAQATVHLAMAPKSNTVIVGIDEAMADVRAGAVGEIPAHLRYGRYAGARELGTGSARGPRPACSPSADLTGVRPAALTCVERQAGVHVPQSAQTGFVVEACGVDVTPVRLRIHHVPTARAGSRARAAEETGSHHATAVPSSSTIWPGIARRVTPSMVVVGATLAAPSRPASTP